MAQRRAFLLLLASVLFLVGCNPAAEPVPGPTDSTFRIVAYNAEWLFDGHDDPNGSPWTTAAAARGHLEDVAGLLAALDADYISLAEVESAEMLSRLNALLGGAYTPIFVQGTDTSTGQDVAALSTLAPKTQPTRSDDRVAYPVPGSWLACDTGTSGVSKHYRVDLDLHGTPVTILAAHFLAYPDRCDRSIQREAQATVIAGLARSALAQGREVIILGDLNDFDGVTLDAAGSRPSSQVLSILKNLDRATEGDELVNVCAKLPQAQRYTNWYDRDKDGVDDGLLERSQIDYILVSRALAERVSFVAIAHTTPAGEVSDHWPIVVDLVMPAGAAATAP